MRNWYKNTGQQKKLFLLLWPFSRLALRLRDP